jgi:hypothetical protein
VSRRMSLPASSAIRCVSFVLFKDLTREYATWIKVASASRSISVAYRKISSSVATGTVNGNIRISSAKLSGRSTNRVGGRGNFELAPRRYFSAHGDEVKARAAEHLRCTGLGGRNGRVGRASRCETGRKEKTQTYEDAGCMRACVGSFA